jgi:hypothetical protein
MPAGGVEQASPDEVWFADKVRKGVLATAAAKKFTRRQVEEWEALFEFHDA